MEIKSLLSKPTKTALGAMAVSLSLGSMANLSQAAEPGPHRLNVRLAQGADHPWISATADPQRVEFLRLDRSFDLRNWEELLRGEAPLIDVPDLMPRAGLTVFYRARYWEPAFEDDWKNVLRGRIDSFQSLEGSPDRREPRWVKFIVLLDEPQRPIFQDSKRYPFHYDFAVARLPRFKGMTRAQFESVTLRTNAQTALLGAVLFSPTENVAEAGIQLAGFDPYSREALAGWFKSARAMLGVGPGTEVFYFPTYEQQESALAHAAWLAEQGIQVSSAARWVISDEVYAPGWALGRLVFLPATEIAAAYREGRLTHADILVTDGVPAEVPPLAGIISLAPATPNSHVALLARSFGIPFAHLTQPGFRELAMSWVGREVVLRATEDFGFIEAKVVPLAGELPGDMRTNLAALKTPPRLNIPEKIPAGTFSIAVDELDPTDIAVVGGKAANLGVLRRSIPTNSPSPAIAFTFDLWDAYLNQTLSGGKTLRQTIAERLAGVSWPPNIAQLQTALADIRMIITDEANFSAAQQTAILSVLQSAGFDPGRKIRFRSSTNVEDGEQFSGAGLYDSYSGCLADDLDGDTTGPSHCEPEEPRERGVFRALRKVFASFYNENAFLERLRHGVDESKAGMAILVHHSTPDEIEMANGVGTLEIRHYPSGSWMITGKLVTQLGAVSVANPDTTARPEEVQIVEFSRGSQPYLSVATRSSLVQLGAAVLEWEQDYRELYRLLKQAAWRWKLETGTNELTVLDFEYKKVEPGSLRVKQIRTVPQINSGPKITPYLMGTTNRYAIHQAEFGDVVANHRLKSLWNLTTRHLHLTESNRVATLFTNVTGEWRHGTNAVQLSGPFESFPGYSFERQQSYQADRWTLGTDSDLRQYELRVFDLPDFAPWRGPLVLLDDHRVELEIRYTTPQPTLTFEEFTVTNTVSEAVWLAPVPPVTQESKLQQRTLSGAGLEISTSYYWPREPGGTGAGYTAPIIAWAGTTITGLASRPIILQSEFAQTYRPGHHNISEDFLFDPWLEPGIDPQLLNELAALNIRAVIVRRGLPATPLSAGATTAAEPPSEAGSLVEENAYLFWGLDGQIRQKR